MAIVSRTASEPCIYWSPSATAGICTANTYFSILTISCYNSGACDGAGTCLECSRYDRPGLKISTLSETDAFRDSTSSAAAYDQTPANVYVYNLRAKFAKCCYWSGKTIDLSVDSSGAVKPSMVIAGATGGTQTSCSNVSAAAWQVPWKQGSLNNSEFPCNGAKTSCPYYTGPVFEYVIDEKLEFGDRVSAAQIMELRYYSTDWTRFQNPKKEYESVFSEPILWAWSGDFDDAVLDPILGIVSPAPTETSIPGVHEVRLFRNAGAQSSFSSSLYVGPKVIGQTGTQILNNPPNFPTLIKELDSLDSALSIIWPTPASYTSPFVFPSFRIGLNVIQLIVSHDSEYPIYAVNVTKHPKATGVSDEDFVLYMLAYFPDDIKVADPEPGMLGVVFSVDLEFSPELNEIRVFTAKGLSTDGSMHTDACFVKHKFYHSHLAQTSFIDKYGQPVVEPYIDRFVDFSADVSIKNLSKNPSLPTEVLWDSVAYNKSTIYEIEEYFEEWVTDWVAIDCNLVALTISNVNINSTQSWSLSGHPTAPHISSVDLGVWVDRSANPDVPQSQKSSPVQMQLIDTSTTGAGFPCNVVFVAPTTDLTAFDYRYDKFKVVAAYTVYKQSPVLDQDVSKLKYPQYVNNYADLFPYDVSLNTSDNSVHIEGMSFAAYYKTGEEAKRFTMEDFEDTLNGIYKESVANEMRAIASFVKGGDAEATVDELGHAYDVVSERFDQANSGLTFGTGAPVTLENFCNLVSVAGYYEGTQEYRVVFSDSGGRPIGIKRLKLLMQSAVTSCRDVEIYYRWTARGAFVNAGDIHSLLARDSTPLRMAPNLAEYYYTPQCGDHSLQTSSQTFYSKFVLPDESIQWQQVDKDTLLARFPVGSTQDGAMWYPYKACSTPRYDRSDPLSDYVLCNKRVEGFGDNLRRSYWESTRGPDIFWTKRLGPLMLIGCYWSYADGSYKTVQSPTFAGFTRVRSNHIQGPFQTDRESVRVSRHFDKRNVSIRNELIRLGGITGVVSLTPAASSTLFYASGDPIIDEKPIWTHLVDGISVVNRTTSESKDPFSNIVAVSDGGHTVDETTHTDRVALKDAFEVRDITRASERTTDGTLVYSPQEPRWSQSSGAFSSGKDVFWVFKDQKTVWAWMERPKEVERGINGAVIGGIDLYNPSVDAWKKDLSSATRMDDGLYDFVYAPPVFLPDGSLKSNPTISLAGGVAREIDWLTGTLGGAPATYGVDPYDEAFHQPASGATFQIYGKFDGAINGFLADTSGLHEFEQDNGDVYQTYRGLGVSTQVRISRLPQKEIDLTTIGAGPAQKTAILGLSSVTSTQSYTFDLLGYKFAYGISVKAVVGKKAGALFYLPTITVDGKLINDTWQNNVFTIDALRTDATYKTVVRSANSATTLSSVRYKQLRVNIHSLPNKRYLDITNISISVLEPVSLTEKIKAYDRKVNLSTGDTGNRKHGDLYYYYGRTTPDFGLKDIGFDETTGTNTNVQDLKWLGRTARDVILTYNFMDPTGTVFDYPHSPVTAIDGVQQATSGFYHVPGPLNIRTKTQTLVTKKHVSDPIGAQAAGASWSNTVAPDEVSDCANAVQPGIRDELLQECLYREAQDAFGRSAVTRYESYWHPDEVEFFVNTVGLPAMPSWELVLDSSFSELSRVMRHPGYGSARGVSNEYYDGRVHKIPVWRALGHLMHLGNPVFNWTCTAVILNKIGRHLGEELFGKDPAAYDSCRYWPPDSVVGTKIEDPDFYINDRSRWDNPATYTGGVMSVGIPVTIGQALAYAPGGIPRGWLEEMALFPQTKSWPLSDETVINGYRRFGKK